MLLRFLVIPLSIFLAEPLLPLEGGPAPVRCFARVLPKTTFLRIIRGIVLNGIGLADPVARHLAPGRVRRRHLHPGGTAALHVARLSAAEPAMEEHQ
jgi:hypothetical protein